MRSIPLLLWLVAAPAYAAPAWHDPVALRQSVEGFLGAQAAGLPGDITIDMVPLDPRLKVAACPAPEVFLPPGARVWGRTTVGVRCTAPTPWTLYLQVTVHVTADYVATARPLSQGRILEAGDLVTARGDLTSLPTGIFTAVSPLLGRVIALSIPMGTPLRQDALKTVPVMQQGQSVRVMSTGTGFSISADGQALSNAADGQVAQVRMPSGIVVSGVARAGGILEVAVR